MYKALSAQIKNLINQSSFKNDGFIPSTDVPEKIPIKREPNGYKKTEQ